MQRQDVGSRAQQGNPALRPSCITGQSQGVLKLFGCRRISQVSGEAWKRYSCVDSWGLPSFLLQHRQWKGHGWSAAAFCRSPGATAAKTTLICSLGPICCLRRKESSNCWEAYLFSVGTDWAAWQVLGDEPGVSRQAHWAATGLCCAPILLSSKTLWCQRVLRRKILPQCPACSSEWREEGDWGESMMGCPLKGSCWVRVETYHLWWPL